MGRHVLPPGMILAELWGGVMGLLREYPRSLKRTERIRRQFPHDDVLPHQQFGCHQENRVSLQKKSINVMK
jgi:hypothetical protein